MAHARRSLRTERRSALSVVSSEGVQVVIGKGCEIRGGACGENAGMKIGGGDAGEGCGAIVVAVVPFALHDREEDREGGHAKR